MPFACDDHKLSCDDHSTFDMYTVARMEDNYRAYLIRLTRHDSRSPWRGMLQDARDNTVRHFATERELYLFLMEQLMYTPPATAIGNGDGQD